MQTMEQSLAELVIRQTINVDLALTRSSRPEQLLGLLERAGFEMPDTSSNGADSALHGVGGLRVAGS
jgi:hypothetical protein